MDSDTRATQQDSRARLRRRHVALVVVGLLAAAALWWVAPWHAARPITVTGTAYANSDRTAIGFDADRRLDEFRHGLARTGYEGFAVEGASWAGTDGVWITGGPVECLRATAHTRVELSFVDVRYGNDGGGPARVVTSLRCLE